MPDNNWFQRQWSDFSSWWQASRITETEMNAIPNLQGFRTAINLLDDYRPEWAYKVDPEKLYMESCYFCVLGQVFASEVPVESSMSPFTLGLDSLLRGGGTFDLHGAFSLDEYRPLWVAEITRRQEEHAADLQEQEDYTKQAAQLLDRIVPDWAQRVQIAELDMFDCEKCILGQVFAIAALEAGMEDGYSYGTHLPELDDGIYDSSVFAMPDYAPFWIVEIKQRVEVAAE